MLPPWPIILLLGWTPKNKLCDWLVATWREDEGGTLVICPGKSCAIWLSCPLLYKMCRYCRTSNANLVSQTVRVNHWLTVVRHLSSSRVGWTVLHDMPSFVPSHCHLPIKTWAHVSWVTEHEKAFWCDTMIYFLISIFWPKLMEFPVQLQAWPCQPYHC